MKDYYVGLDIGTDSVGIACTDPSYNLLRAKGRDAWAVRLFDTAETAVGRRQKRTARRRLQRRKFRIGLLQELFGPQMEQLDPLFFLRLENSPYLLDDKDARLGGIKYALFADAGYTDKEFYRAFPTIYHLRRALIEGSRKYDLRLYYLALHHIVKYRGHFLIEGDLGGNGIADLGELLEKVNEAFADEDGEPLGLDPALAPQFDEILRTTRGLNDRKRASVQLFGAKDRAKAVVEAMCGAKVKPSALFEGRYEEEKNLDLRGLSTEEFEGLQATYGDDFAALQVLRAVNDRFVLKKILGEHTGVSEAMVAIYEKHKADLHRLKRFVRAAYGADEYAKIFRKSDVENNYAAYVGFTKPQKTKQKVKICKPDDFFKFLNKELSRPVPQEYEAERDAILVEIGNDEFLQKILHADNGRFPHQLNLREMKAILDNLVRDYPAFGEVTETIDGRDWTTAQKIESLLTFRIPYYVGPLNPAHTVDAGGHSWVARKARGRVTPWNFDVMVDREESSERFMRNMLSKCTYLHAENVLPKQSMLYQAFNTLNQLNKLTIDEQPISVELKQRLFRDLYCTRKHVTDKAIIDYCVRIGQLSPQEGKGAKIGGKLENINPSMSTYILFREKFGELVDREPAFFEDVVRWHALNEDKQIVRRKIEQHEKYAEIVNGDASLLKWLCSLGFKDFGQLSEAFLCRLQGGVDPVTGVVYTILERLYNTNHNLNELLFAKEYEFSERLQKENAGDENVTYEDIEDLYLSPAVRRGVWQSLRMVDEYVAAFGAPPTRIFVEVTRSDEKDKKGKPTQSRKTTLLDMLKTKPEHESIVGTDTIEEIVRLVEQETDFKLRQERLYLYYKQLGRCAYSGEPIDLGDLDTDRYDVDHILPQSLVKDDSIENKVLVKTALNHQKSDRYPVPDNLRQDRLWRQWREMGLIGDKKFKLLTRREPLTDADLEGFIARQIVITGQTVKAVAELLARKYPETKIVYSKAANVSEFRSKYGLDKCRETNDLHHARDAYLNIVVGNVYHTRFTDDPRNFYRERRNNEEADRIHRYNLKRLFDYDVEGAWHAQTDLVRVKKICARTSMAVTRYATERGGAFYDETVYPHNDSGVAEPRKRTGPLAGTAKYGGYKSLKTAYFAIVESDGKKGVRQKTIEAIPVLIAYRAQRDPDAVRRWLTDTGLRNPTILCDKIRVQSLLTIDGTPLRLAGVTGNRILYHNAIEWFTSPETDRYVKALVRFLEFADKVADAERYDIRTNRTREASVWIDRAQNLALYDLMRNQLAKPAYAFPPMQTFADNMDKSRAAFAEKSVKDQCKVLLQCVKFFKCNAELVDLSLVGCGEKCGILRANKNITDCSVYLVHQSPCGLSERRIKV